MCAGVGPHWLSNMLGSVGIAGIDAGAVGGLKYCVEVHIGWLNVGAGEGSSKSPAMVVQKDAWPSLLAVVVGLGVEGNTLHGSTGGGCNDAPC